MKKHLPNFLTSCNLLCGCIATVMIFRNRLDIAAYLIFVAAIFDVFDGMAARMVSSNSELGKQLDSLADMISFGFVPGAVMFKLLQSADMNLHFHSEIFIRIIQFFPFIISVFSALRLANFNIDTRQSNSFIGLPTPANTLFIVSLPLILKQFPMKYDSLILNPYFILSVSIIGSILLVAELPLFSLKFKTLVFKDNIFQYLLLIIALILFPIFLFAAIPILIILYILLSIVQNYTKAKT